MGLQNTNTEKQYDINMLFVLFLFGVVSCFYIYFAQQMGQYDANFSVRQMFFYIIAFGVALVVLHFDFEYYLNIHWFLYGFGLFLLILLEIIGPHETIAPMINGAVSWFTLPVIGSIQPSELMRIFLVITLSAVTYRHNSKYQNNRDIKTDLTLLGKMALVVLPVLILLERQPDMGSVMLIGSIVVALMIVSGISYKLLLLFIGGPLFVFASFIFAFFRFPVFVETYLLSMLQDYQVNRIHGWLNPFEYVDAGFQTVRAITAIGSGRLFGNNDTSIYIPEAHTDFIFAVISSMHGFIGGALVITLYFVLLYQILITALRCHNAFGKYLCASLIGMLSFQVFQNIGMSLGLLPVTGFTLPLLSYGGSSLIATMFALGMVMSVRYHSKSYFFESRKE
ncbi:FtsW/RodA/SpoVE family cell cycle protein [Alteribacillus iranensis]|uniref:Cell division protein FtsW, lipid II flippase n=1 Tax=Alteribacillus iranensis TaxID=930128 RepID=A0A1I2CSZ8_9BACI|nr:FtsW/RodA/SpoVE family cell cycle protein [Alteribacillus iranensis]SFE71439.1 cell division protein FtsW, lipid II flippase [Alteribacillus iranensis]